MKKKAGGAKKAADVASAWPAGPAKPAIRALTGAGYTSLEQLTKASDEALLELHGMGPNTLRTLRAASESQGKQGG